MKIVIMMLICFIAFSHNVFADSLMRAVKKGDLSKVKTLISQGISPNQTDENDWRETPPLFAAIKSKNTDISVYLIKSGADCKALDDTGKNALVHVAQAGSSSLVSPLVACGATLEVEGGLNRTPLVWAVLSDHEDVAIELVNNGAMTAIEWTHPTKFTKHQLIDTVQKKGMNKLASLMK